MQILADKHGDFRASLSKLETETLATLEDTMMDISSDDYTVTPQESLMSETWTELNGGDVDLSLPHESLALENLIERNVVVIERHVLSVMAWRDNKHINNPPHKLHGDSASLETDVQTLLGVASSRGGGGTEPGAKGPLVPNNRLPSQARDELILYVSNIASLYRDVLYHNFEHASHVVASTDVLIAMLKNKRPQNHNNSKRRCSASTNFSDITSDFSTSQRNHPMSNDLSNCPLIHVALVICALVHDVEHQGVGNKQLVDEDDPLAIKYNGKSVAENHSLDVALQMLQEPRYSCLYTCIVGTPDDSNMTTNHNERLFRRIFYDIILATDINSQERLQRNKEKWKLAFEETERSTCTCPILESIQHSDPSLKERKTPSKINFESENDTIQCMVCTLSQEECFPDVNYLHTSAVVEQLIQAADIAHNMQSWEIFLKWNIKLYNELWAAKLARRGPDVSANWFKGQIGFFDFYIIPLAKRLEQCGIFGSLGSLFLYNTNQNRRRWIEEGEERCGEMHSAIVQKLGDGS